MAAKANWHWNYVTFTLCIDIFGTLCRRHHLTCQNSKWSPQWGYLGKYMKYHSRARGSFLFFDRLFAHASSQNHTTDFYAVCVRTLTCHLLLWHNRCCCDVISLTDASLYRNSCTLSFFSQTTVVCQVIITVPVRLLFTTSFMIVYNYDADLEVSDTCVRSSLLSWVELPQLASFWKKTFNFLALCVWRLLPSLCLNMPTFCGYADVFTPVTLC